MSPTAETQVRIDEERAGRLEQLAILHGTTPDALVAKALDLLFLAEPASSDIPAEIRADWELLRQLDAEANAGSAEPTDVHPRIGTPSRFDLTQGNITHRVPVSPGKLRRFGDDL